jgi:hypothetical protein
MHDGFIWSSPCQIHTCGFKEVVGIITLSSSERLGNRDPRHWVTRLEALIKQCGSCHRRRVGCATQSVLPFLT